MRPFTNLPHKRQLAGPTGYQLPDITGKLQIDLEMDRVWKPLKDHRSLGIAVAEVKYLHGCAMSEPPQIWNRIIGSF